MSLIPVAPDMLATVVTTLDMREPPRLRPMPDVPLRLVPWPAPSVDRYRALFRRVGAPWLWYSRLAMADDALSAILDDEQVAVHAVVDRASVEVGMLELDFREPGICELSYFGLIPELAGRGIGRWLMAHALALAWRPGVSHVWVHTCTLDHPRALGFYIASGFTARKRTLETFPDPRIVGLLPFHSAPQIPRLTT